MYPFLVRQVDVIELSVPTMAIPSSIKAVVYLSGEGFCQFILHKSVPQMKYRYVTLLTKLLP